MRGVQAKGLEARKHEELACTESFAFEQIFAFRHVGRISDDTTFNLVSLDVAECIVDPGRVLYAHVGTCACAAVSRDRRSLMEVGNALAGHSTPTCRPPIPAYS